MFLSSFLLRRRLALGLLLALDHCLLPLLLVQSCKHRIFYYQDCLKAKVSSLGNPLASKISSKSISIRFLQEFPVNTGIKFSGEKSGAYRAPFVTGNNRTQVSSGSNPDRDNYLLVCGYALAQTRYHY